MKNAIKTFLFVSIVLVLAGCSSQIQKDAKEIAKMTCEYQELTRKEFILSSTMKEDKAKEVKEKMEVLDEKLNDRTLELMELYKSDEEQKEFRGAVKKALSKCMK